MFHPSVRSTWISFSRPKEGHTGIMYQDVKGLVTTLVGVLIDSPEAALQYPWRFIKTKTPANADQVRWEWRKIKNGAGLASGGLRAASQIASLEIPPEDIDRLTLERFDLFASHLLQSYPTLGQWPADAQRALMSMAWAAGTNLPVTFPRFTAALQRQDFFQASVECILREERNPGLSPRNASNVFLLLSAAKERGQRSTPVQYSLQTLLGRQQLLQRLHFYRGPLDGLTTSSYIQAVRDFQRDNGLVADGVVGPRTLMALELALEQTRPVQG
jgi:hypothetical protein